MGGVDMGHGGEWSEKGVFVQWYHDVFEELEKWLNTLLVANMSLPKHFWRWVDDVLFPKVGVF